LIQILLIKQYLNSRKWTLYIDIIHWYSILKREENMWVILLYGTRSIILIFLCLCLGIFFDEFSLDLLCAWKS
jgi:hypothetical protein